jgi:hypothetical protein
MEEGSFQNQRIIGFQKRLNAERVCVYVCVCVLMREPHSLTWLEHSAPGSFFGFLRLKFDGPVLFKWMSCTIKAWPTLGMHHLDIEKAAMSNCKLQDGNDFVLCTRRVKYLLLFTREESKWEEAVCVCEKR